MNLSNPSPYPSTMKSWQVTKYGAPTQALEMIEARTPRPLGNQLLVEVQAAALNFPDILLCEGTYQIKPPLPFSPGLEISGRVVEVADPANEHLLGELVAGLPAMGGYSQYCLVDADSVFALPSTAAHITPAKAAGFTITYQTGHVGLFHRGKLTSGETLLVHAGAGGVGSAAIQLGKAIGARVIATAGGADKVEFCRSIGADDAFDYRTQDIRETVLELTAGKGADVIYDPVGGEVFMASRRCVAWEGRILVIGFTSGIHAEAPTNHILVKNYSVIGVHWGAYRAHNPEVVTAAHEDLMRLWLESSIDPLVSQTYNFADLPEALSLLKDRKTQGKVVVTP